MDMNIPCRNISPTDRLPMASLDYIPSTASIEAGSQAERQASLLEHCSAVIRLVREKQYKKRSDTYQKRTTLSPDVLDFFHVLRARGYHLSGGKDKTRSGE